MKTLKFSTEERRALREQIQLTQNAKILRRAQALLWYSQGIPVVEISDRLEVNRQNVYNWIDQFRARKTENIVNRLADRSRPGRPAEKIEETRSNISRIIEKSPKEYGYRYAVWTAPLLAKHLEKVKRIEVSHDTVRRCLKEMDYTCKRPRYALSRRSPTWRESKGG